MLKHRIFTAAVIIFLLFLALFYLPPRAFSCLIAVIVARAAWEWALFIPIEKITLRIFYTVAMVLVLCLSFSHTSPILLFIPCLSWLWAAVAVICYKNNKSPVGIQYPLIKCLMGFLVIIPFGISIKICHQGILSFFISGSFLLIYGLLIPCSVDIGGYIAGQLYGTHKLAERISPNKTWEGFWGGISTASLLVLIVGIVLKLSFLLMIELAILTLITALFSILGDLFESVLKRQVNLKDSGNLLPGHGGLLDRIDSVIAELPLFTLGCWIFTLCC